MTKQYNIIKYNQYCEGKIKYVLRQILILNVIKDHTKRLL